MPPLYFAFCVSDSYVPYICVTIESIVKHHSQESVVVYILIDSISNANRNRLISEFDQIENLSINVIIVDDTKLKRLNCRSWSIYTWYRILLPDVLPKEIHRVLYIDADVIINDNISAIFNLDMKNKSVAGVLDCESFNEYTYKRINYASDKGYICAGVLLMNLDYWREKSLADAIYTYAIQNAEIIKFPDQDAINVICQDTKIILPLRYGIVSSLLKIPEIYSKYREQVLHCYKNPAVVHYAATAPWVKEFHNHPYYNIWKLNNSKLKKRVKSHYITKGWLLFKYIVYNLISKRPNAYQSFIDYVEAKLNETL